MRRDQLAVLMGRASRHATRHFERELGPLGVTPVEGTVLTMLGQARSASLGELARMWEVSPPMMSRTVDRLVELGHVERREDPRDRRRMEVAVTSSGEEVGRRVAQIGGEITERMASGLSEGEVEQLKDYLRRVIDALASHEEQHGR